MTSYHIIICVNFVWTLLVASCVCVAEVRTRVSNAFISRTKEFSSKEFISDTKCVHNYIEINEFFCSVIFYLEVSSRDYRVTSDKRVSLQCDIGVKRLVLNVS